MMMSQCHQTSVGLMLLGHNVCGAICRLRGRQEAADWLTGCLLPSTEASMGAKPQGDSETEGLPPNKGHLLEKCLARRHQQKWRRLNRGTVNSGDLSFTDNDKNGAAYVQFHS